MNPFDRSLFLVLSLWLCCSCLVSKKGSGYPGFASVQAFQHNSCTSDVAKQFQFSDCYLPDLADDLLLSEAGFVMSHDAATGYLTKTKGLVTNGATNLYAKNQIGGVYRQLDDGARALDVRPKLLRNGTVVLHHGALPIAVTLEKLVRDARRWAADNPDELVLILHNNFAYPKNSSSYSQQAASDDNADDNEEGSASNDAEENENQDDDGYTIVPSADTTVEVLSQVYESLGVAYVECSDLYGLTVGEAKELARLSVMVSSGDDDNNDDNDQTGTQTLYPAGGYLLAMDRHDVYAGSCAKPNWVQSQVVTCYSSDEGILPCTDRKSVQHQKLKDYALASANNEPTDSLYVLGPPASAYTYPFNEIQALWQVDGISAALGVSHVSSIIDDNTKSHLNARVVDWVYDDLFDAISLLAVDHVRLNGNALASVLRNRCGQSKLSYEEEGRDGIPCGSAIPKPHIRQGRPLSTLSFFATTLVCMVLGLWIAVFLAHYRKHHDHQKEVEILEKDLQAAMTQCGCTEALAPGDEDDELQYGCGEGLKEMARNTIPRSVRVGKSKREPLIKLPTVD